MVIKFFQRRAIIFSTMFFTIIYILLVINQDANTIMNNNIQFVESKIINIAKRVIVEETEALKQLSTDIPKDFTALVKYIINLKGKIILTGIGKSGYIAHKIAASFASTGTTAIYVHPAEASHGDLGMIEHNDLVIMLSNSGETKELQDIINYCKKFIIKIAGITMNYNSTLTKNSDFKLVIPKKNEVSSISAPTTSSLMMLCLGDALITSVHETKEFSKDDFYTYHPGGKIGANLIKVQELMRIEESLPTINPKTSFQDTLVIMTKKSLGCALIIDNNLRLIGIITDGDLRRNSHNFTQLKYASDLMTVKPIQIEPSRLATEALAVMNQNKITSIPVTENGTLKGLVHIHDLIRAGVT